MTTPNFSTSPIPTTKSNTKSRKGCSECKRKRVKCDEGKPVCTRCLKSRNAGAAAGLCDYGLKLSWTQGRPFKRRRVGSGVGTVEGIGAGAEAGLGNERAGGVGGGAEDSLSPGGGRVPLEQASGGLENSEVGGRGSEIATPYVGDGWTVDVPETPTPQHTPSQFEDAPDDDSLEVPEAGAMVTKGIDHVPEDVDEEYALVPDLPDEAATIPQYVDEEYALMPVSPGQAPIIPEDVDEEYALVPASPYQAATIPPTPSPYPLLCPTESPNAYFFLHHYSVHTATTLFPLLPPAARDSLLSVAATSPPLLSALLAISANQYCQLKGDLTPDSKSRALFFSRKALLGLQKAMQDPHQRTSYSTISTVLALCTNDVLMSGNVQGWKTHLRGAEQLLTLAIGQSRNSTTVTDPSTLFLIKWFAALDMFAGVSSLEKTLVPDGRYWSIGASSPDGSTQYVDDFVGFSLELMPLLSRISRMARLQQRKSALATAATVRDTEAVELAEDLDALLADNVVHTEEQLIALLWRVSSPSIVDVVAAEEAQQAHRLFVYAALLHLYRRVQELPKDHVKPDHAMSMIIEIIGKLRADSPASIVILWPLFSAGCETDDPVRRKIIWDRMVDLRRYGMGNVDQALVAMQEYWMSDTGERWDVFLGRLGVDLVLF